MLRTILFVDKDVLFAEQMRRVFLDAGFRVIHVQSEAGAEEVFSSIRPDVMITEVMLDHADGGFCLAWKLKKTHQIGRAHV